MRRQSEATYFGADMVVVTPTPVLPFPDQGEAVRQHLACHRGERRVRTRFEEEGEVVFLVMFLRLRVLLLIAGVGGGGGRV